MALGLSEASLIAFFVESVLFGGFSVLFAVTLYSLYQKKSLASTRTIFCVCISMYILGLIHVIIGLQRTIEGFTDAIQEEGGSDTFFTDITASSYVVKTGIYEAQTILGDGFMIYRLYVVWEKDKRILIPGLIWMLGSTSLAFYGVISLTKLKNASSIFIMTTKNIGLSFYSITLGVNLICTALIAYRIWGLERRIAGGAYRSRNLNAVVASIIESGAIYSAWLIALIATFATNSWSHYLVLDALPQLIGIVFTLIIVRIALGLATASQSTSQVYSAHSNYRVSRPPIAIAVRMTSVKTMQNDMGDPVVVTGKDRESGNVGNIIYKDMSFVP